MVATEVPISLAQVSRLDWRRHHWKMEPQGNGKQAREKTSRTNREARLQQWAGSRDQNLLDPVEAELFS